jgi:hypothetical protein
MGLRPYDDSLVAPDAGFNAATLIVARHLLPAEPALLRNILKMAIALCGFGCSGSSPGHFRMGLRPYDDSLVAPGAGFNAATLIVARHLLPAEPALLRNMARTDERPAQYARVRARPSSVSDA